MKCEEWKVILEHIGTIIGAMMAIAEIVIKYVQIGHTGGGEKEDGVQ